MDKKNFLFELGVEEIPAAYIYGAVKTIKDHFVTNLKKANLDYDELQIFSTPRRFAIKISLLQTQQKDEIIEQTGPTKEIAYDKDGNLTSAALGFLRSAEANEKDIIIKNTSKGEKIAIKRDVKGKSAEDILQQIILEVIPKINFPKSMKWGNSKLTFARPIRWLLALFGNDVLNLEFENIKSGNITFGNRFQKLYNPIKINMIDEYEEKLKSVFVIPDRGKRFKLIQVGIEENLNSIQNEYHDKLDYVDNKEKLINIVTDLVEYPTPILSEFDIKYLELFNNIPNVIILTLSEHQKYFPIVENGDLTNKFIIIGNGNPEYKELIKLGNNKVVNARLADAEFYYNEDTKISLENYVPKLKEVIFQSKLGTLFEKTERIKNITSFLCDELDINGEVKKHSLRAAHLCKADLVTLMLGEKEYTKLQGMVGYEYALKSEEDIKVATAIFSHYMPRSNHDSLPIGKEGAILAIADKIDTICGIIGVDMIPTGSKDPFALRRAANGVVQIISNNKFDIDIHKLIDRSFELLKSKLDKPENNKDVVYGFFEQRVNWLLKQKQIDYDIIDSVMHIDHSDIPDLVTRAEALQELKKRDDFIKLVLGFKRVSNIIAEVKEISNVKQEMLQEEMEQNLYTQYLDLKIKIEKLLPDKNYKKILEELVEYGNTIDNFFDEVLVNVEDAEIKQNRYNILSCIRELFLRIADLSKLVVDGEK